MEDNKTIQTQLLQCKAENQKLRLQLHGLITLVRKAWMGDHSAAIDVAKIVGVSPPTLEISSMTDELAAVPKPPVVNNWLKLSTCLVSKEDKQEQIKEKQQLTFLRNQEAFIDEQMGKKEYQKESSFNETKLRTNSLHQILKKENDKRDALRKELGKVDTQKEKSVSRKEANSARKKVAFGEKHIGMEAIDERKLGDCLVVQANSQRHQKKPSTKTRPKSAGCALNERRERGKTTTKKRPESAKVTLTQKKSPHRTAGRGRQSGDNRRIDRELGETEEDIALTIELLQKRLGIDREGMV